MHPVLKIGERNAVFHNTGTSAVAKDTFMSFAVDGVSITGFKDLTHVLSKPPALLAGIVDTTLIITFVETALNENLFLCLENELSCSSWRFKLCILYQCMQNKC